MVWAKSVASVGNHRIEALHDLGHGVLEAFDADLAAFLDVGPIQLVLGPGLERELAEHLGRVGSPGGASRSKPAISGRLMMRPPRLAAASAIPLR